MPNRTDVLNRLAEARGYQRYLEIGTRNVGDNFARVVCPIKVGVDPVGGPGVEQMTSDAFFTARRPKRGRIGAGNSIPSI